MDGARPLQHTALLSHSTVPIPCHWNSNERVPQQNGCLATIWRRTYSSHLEFLPKIFGM